MEMIKHSCVERQRCSVSRLRYHGMVLTLALFTVFILISLAKADAPIIFAAPKSSWIVWLADERGLFEKNGVDVKVELVTSGVAAAKGLISGNFDLATMSEYTFASKSFIESDLRLIGTVGAMSDIHLIGRRDRGVVDAGDLAGKRVGLEKGTISQFFLAKLLDIKGIDPRSLTIVNYQPALLAKALQAGEVDAIVSWEPYANFASETVGELATEVNVEDGLFYYFVLAAKTDATVENTVAITNVIAALVQASDWAVKNQAEAKRIMHARLGVSRDALDKFWPDHVMDVTLTQDLVFLMSEQAIFLKESGLRSGEIPDYLSRIYFDALETVDPSRVSMIR